MEKSITINQDELIHQVKLGCLIPTLVGGVVVRKIVMQAAQEHKIVASVDELQQAADGIRLLRQLNSSTDTRLWLEQHNLSLDEFEELVQTSVLSSKLASTLFAGQAESIFAERQLDYTKAVLYEVLLDDLDLANELFYAIEENETTFWNVSHQFIREVKLRRIGGYQGVLNRSNLKPEISTAVFSATPPQLLKPIITSKGVHLIFVEEIIQPELNDAVLQKIVSDLFIDWLKNEIESLKVLLYPGNEGEKSIEIYPQYLGLPFW